MLVQAFSLPWGCSDKIIQRKASTNSDSLESIPVFYQCESNGNNVKGNGLLMNTSVSGPLRLNGGGDTSSFSEDSMSEQDIRDILFDAGYTLEDINDIMTLKSGSNESVKQSKCGYASIASATNRISGNSRSARTKGRKSGNVIGNRNYEKGEAESNLSYQDNGDSTNYPSLTEVLQDCTLNVTSDSYHTGTSEIGSSFDYDESADKVLKEIRIKNVNRVTIGTLNINSLSPKFEQLKAVIGKNLDILTIQETKLDSSFPTGQFKLEGYSEPYRLDRNRNGGGVMIYVREDIPSKLLSKHNFTKNVEGMFVEINLRKTKLLFLVLIAQIIQTTN